jgi:tetratricopeptide (TPR) repeat protein
VEPGPDPRITRLFRPNATVETAEQAAGAVQASRHAGGAESIGWIYLDAGRLDQAEAWFSRAYRWQPNASRAEGLARTLGRLGRLNEVERLEQKWPEQLAGLTREARTSRLTQAFLARAHGEVLDLSEQLDDDPAALGFRGWTLLRLMRPTEAEDAFGRVLRIGDATLEQRREAVFGLARSALAIGNVNRAEGLVRLHDLLPHQRYELLAEIISHKANEAFRFEDYRVAVQMYETRRHYAEPSRGLLMQEAWARYHLGQKSAAARIFVRLDRIQRTPETEAALEQVARYLDGYTF